MVIKLELASAGLSNSNASLINSRKVCYIPLTEEAQNLIRQGYSVVNVSALRTIEDSHGQYIGKGCISNR